MLYCAVTGESAVCRSACRTNAQSGDAEGCRSQGVIALSLHDQHYWTFYTVK